MPDGGDVCAVAGERTVEMPRLTVPTNLRIDIVRAVMMRDGAYGSVLAAANCYEIISNAVMLVKRRH
jgi:hypothetical protein